MTKTIYQYVKSTITLISVCLLLNACDGGIFGTGDGGDNLLIPGGESATDVDVTDGGLTDTEDGTGTESDETNDSNDTPIEVPETPNNATPIDQTPADSTVVGIFTNDFVPSEDVTIIVDEPMAFTNSVAVEDSSTEATLVNDTDSTIGVYATEESNARALITLSPKSFGFFFLTPSMNTLYIDELTASNDRVNLFSIAPLSVSAASNSLLVIANTQTTPKLIIMPSYNSEGSNGTIPVRLIAASLAGDPEVPSTITLTPDPSYDAADVLPTITFEPITNELPVTRYLNVPPGEYLLNDDVGRFVNNRISLREDTTVRTTVLGLTGTFITVSVDL